MSKKYKKSNQIFSSITSSRSIGNMFGHKIYVCNDDKLHLKIQLFFSQVWNILTNVVAILRGMGPNENYLLKLQSQDIISHVCFNLWKWMILALVNTFVWLWESTKNLNELNSFYLYGLILTMKNKYFWTHLNFGFTDIIFLWAVNVFNAFLSNFIEVISYFHYQIRFFIGLLRMKHFSDRMKMSFRLSR